LVLREHGDTGFVGWEPEPNSGETFENVESTWYDDDEFDNAFWTEEGWEELKI
jgi:hypothetical protein